MSIIQQARDFVNCLLHLPGEASPGRPPSVWRPGRADGAERCAAPGWSSACADAACVRQMDARRGTPQARFQSPEMLPSRREL